MATNSALLAMVSASMNKKKNVTQIQWSDRDDINPSASLWSMDNFWGDCDLWITSAIIGGMYVCMSSYQYVLRYLFHENMLWTGLQQEVVISMSEDKMLISITDEFYRVRKVC